MVISISVIKSRSRYVRLSSNNSSGNSNTYDQIKR